MTTCEFKKECETAIVGKCTHPEWRIEEDDCPHREFAILVVNRTVQKALDIWPGALEVFQALKMEED